MKINAQICIEGTEVSSFQNCPLERENYSHWH